MEPNFYPKGYLQTIYMIYTKRKEEEALRYLERYKNNNVVATVSGKDSIVAAHLFARVKSSPPILINRYIGRRKLPDEIVNELRGIAELLTSDIIISDLTWNGHSNLFVQIARHYNFDVIVTGLREQEDDWESVIRVGEKLVSIAAPLRRWRHSDVWAYLFTHKIPVPKIYREAPVPWASLQSLIFS
jgi:3'-phosphoadenosine 5'-phosphosulfate sulfotransferase (PAPS reductase)/FAD synthetase